MADTKWTPGPWEIGGDRSDTDEYQLGHEGWPLCVGVRDASSVHCDYHVALGIQRAADARLIAAAPDLYEALKQLDDMYARAWDLVSGELAFSAEIVARFEKIHNAAGAALAKARGEKSNG